MPVLSAAERIGTVLDEKYAIQRVLAQGGMGIVFEAIHSWTGRRVALKLIKPDLVEPTREARLLLEARLAASLSHPNVVQVLDMGASEDGASYLVMELLEGRTLKEELIERGTLPPAEALAIVLPLLGAIAVAHDRGIVHRDIKPANIMLSRDPAQRRVPKLLDFGIAKAIEDTGVTRSGAVLGTPHYLSPEQAEGTGEIGPASDIWALGVILYECLAGQLPFPGEHVASVLHRVLNQPAPPLRSHAPHVGAALAQAVERALRRDLTLRYEDARSFARALLVTAREDGVELPEAPDPAGLPDWATWQRDASVAPDSTADGANGDASDPVAAQPEANAARAASTRPARSPALLAVLALLALFTGFGYVFARQHSARVSASPRPARERQAHAPATTTTPVPASVVVTEAKPAREPSALSVEPAAPASASAAAPAPAPAPAVLSSDVAPGSKPRPKRRSPQRAPMVNAPVAAPADAPSGRDMLMQSW